MQHKGRNTVCCFTLNVVHNLRYCGCCYFIITYGSNIELPAYLYLHYMSYVAKFFLYHFYVPRCCNPAESFLLLFLSCKTLVPYENPSLLICIAFGMNIAESFSCFFALHIGCTSQNPSFAIFTLNETYTWSKPFSILQFYVAGALR